MEEIAKIYHTALETPLEISSESVQLLIVENPALYYRFVSELDAQMEGREGGFSFLRSDAPIFPEKEGIMVCDCFHFDLGDKRVMTLLQKRLADLCRNGEAYMRLAEINSAISSLFSDIFCEVPFLLSQDDITPEELFKSCNVRFERNYETLLEKLICYINALIELKHCKFFVFVNLREVLCDEDLRALYRHCALEKVGLLLLEPFHVRALFREERAIVITEDLCEILENYSES